MITDKVKSAIQDLIMKSTLLIPNRHIDTYVARMSGRCRTIKRQKHLCFA